MMHDKETSRKEKISPAFAARLARLRPGQTIRAMVLLRGNDTEKRTTRRQSRAERKAAIEARKQAAEEALHDIDGILEDLGGQRLADHPDALGSIPIETTAAGIDALAESDQVTAILEDQAIHPAFK